MPALESIDLGQASLIRVKLVRDHVAHGGVEC
jgi:hypothetical protein